MYNYLNDAMRITFKRKEDYKICEMDSKYSTNATICGIQYEDPDAISEKLYKDMVTYFKNILGEDVKVIRQNNQWFIRLKGEYDYDLTTDYIGPSRAWSKRYVGETKEEKANTIGDFLLITRTIGGHIFWPAHQVERKNTINQIKGGSIIYDRIDITLAELKNFYETRNGKRKHLYFKELYDSFFRYEWFFDMFESFEDYIDKMKLNNFIYQGQVISLLDSDLENNKIVLLKNEKGTIQKNYDNYIQNSKIVIQKRTKTILQ